MGVAIIKCQPDFKDFVRKVSFNQEIPLPLVISFDEGNLKVAGATDSSKYYGVYNAVEIDTDGDNTTDGNVVVGIINAKKFIKYLTVIEGDEIILIKPLDDVDVDMLTITDNNGDKFFEVILSSLVEVDPQPLKDDNLFLNIPLPVNTTKTIFEILKLINSDECGILFTQNEDDSSKWDVIFKVGSRYEDRGLVHISTIDENPLEHLSDRFLIKLSDTEIFIKYHHQDMVNCFSVVDKTSDEKVYLKIKKNTGLIVTEENDTYTVSYGFAPYK